MSSGRWSQAKTCVAAAAVQCLVAILTDGGPVVCAQQLPIRHYDVRDGLAHSQVHAIYQDAKGYLWFGTNEGLSRFDGYRFTNYTTRDGLGHAVVSDIVEDWRGHLWVSTNGGGVARLLDDSQDVESNRLTESTRTQRKKFVRYSVGDSPVSNKVDRMVFDAENNLWCVTDVGLYRASRDSLQANEPKFEAVFPTKPVAYGYAALAGIGGRLWFAIGRRLIQVTQGRIVEIGPGSGVTDDWIRGERIEDFIEDRQGRWLVARLYGVFELMPTLDPQPRERWKKLPMALAPGQEITSLAADSTAALWVGTNQGLIKYRDGHQTVYMTAQGLSDNTILALFEDREGNLWIGTREGGVCKLSGEIIVSITKVEGLTDRRIYHVVEARDGRIYASTFEGLVEIVDGRAVPISGFEKPPFNYIPGRILQDRREDWWIGTTEGLYRFPGPALQFRRGKKFTAAGLSVTEGAGLVRALYEDRAGRIWIGGAKGLYWLDPTPNRRPLFQRLTGGAIENPIGMVSDRSGALWLANNIRFGRLVNGQIDVFQPTEAVRGWTSALFEDSRGWVWIGYRYSGVFVTADPRAEHPRFVNYSTQNGLASDAVWSITEDDFGRMYLGTGRGLDRLDPATGRIRHFTTADGLAGDLIWHCLKDSRGHVWVATNRGLSRLTPRAERPLNPPPPIYLTRIQVAGEDVMLPETGARRMPELTLAAARNNLLIEYVGLSFRGEQALSYQYKLEGVDANWNPPTQQRSVTYARLGSGSYQFLVQAINEEGVASPQPAVITFRVLPPVWQRWWFLALAGLFAGVVVYGLYRYRVARLIEVERVRTRIATDLHDEIGTSLSQMAILTEVIKQQNAVAHPQATEMLTQVGETARRLVDTMSDIVWAVDPRRDDLGHLVNRIGRFASGVLGAKGIAWDFQTPPEMETLKLTADQRRHVYLIFKEAISNIARHAGCHSAWLSIGVADHQLEAEIRDDGCGLDGIPQSDGHRPAGGGHGLQNMQARAEELRGQLQIVSAPGQGTRVKLTVPLK
jgi:ligand-binding sensor domain-containing protein/signal transduction histidine kinase